MKYFKRLARHGVCRGRVRQLGASSWLQAQDAPPGDAANGKRLYLADGCFTCHGRSGQGGAYQRSGAEPCQNRHAVRRISRAQLRDPANDMPAYSEAVLSDQDIADIYAFVQSLPGARSAKDISILND